MTKTPEQWADHIALLVTPERRRAEITHAIRESRRELLTVLESVADWIARAIDADDGDEYLNDVGWDDLIAANVVHQMQEIKRLRTVLEELIEVADLRGDTDLPHPEDDSVLWTARMQTAWDEARAAIAEP